MKARDLGALSRMLQHIPPERVLRRAQLVAKRRARQAIERIAPGRLRPTVDATPSPPGRWPQPTLPAIGDGTQSDDEFLGQTRSWITNSPIYQGDYWRNEWHSLAVSDRLIRWMQEIAQRDFAAADLEPVYDSLIEQLAFLARNLQTDIGGYAIARNITALRWGSACFEGPAAAAWADIADGHLATVLREQIPQDGLHVEGCPGRHLAFFATLLELHDVLPAGALQKELATALERIAYAAAFTTDVHGAPFLLGEATLSPARTSASLLQIWRAAGGSVDVVPAVGALADAGLYVYRNDRDLVVVDAGPLGDPAHPTAAHADALSFTWTLDGHGVIVDQGVAPAGEPDLARQTMAHNTVTLDDHDQAELLANGRVGRRWTITQHAWIPREHGFVLTADHDGFAGLHGAPMHRRTVEVKGRKIRIEDRIEGGDGQRAVARLLLHPDVSVRVLGSGAILSVSGLQVDLRTTAAVRSVPAMWGPSADVQLPTTRLELDLGRAPCNARFTLQALDH